MHILFDVNVVLDVLLNRKPWVTEAAAAWRANDEGQIIGYILASAMTDIFYIARRLAGLEMARTTVRTCLEGFEICTVDRQALEQAEALPGNDFEDNLQIACANITGIDAIVTRDKDGFNSATVPVWTPAELLTQLR